MKDVVTTAFGAVVFGGFVATSLSIGGLLLSFLGAFLFGVVSLRKAQKAAAAASAAYAAVAAKHDAEAGTGPFAGGGDSGGLVQSGGAPGSVLRRSGSSARVSDGGSAYASGMAAAPRAVSPSVLGRLSSRSGAGFDGAEKPHAAGAATRH